MTVNCRACGRFLPATDRCRLPSGGKIHTACAMRLQLAGKVVPLRRPHAR